MLVTCRNCRVRNTVPAGAEWPLHCGNCGAFLPRPNAPAQRSRATAENGNKAIAALAGGAAIGGALGGPGGALVGGLLGMLLAAASEDEK
jgi:hypothetical protein